MRQGMAKKSQQAAAKKILWWTHRSGPQPSNWHLSYRDLSRGWEDFGLTIIKLPRHIINRLVYYFVVRCVTFTMQTEIPVSAQEQCVFFLEAVTWKTRLLSGYLASTESKQGEAHLKTSTFPPQGQPNLQSSPTIASPSCIGWALPTDMSNSVTLSQLGLGVISQLTGFVLLPPLCWQLRFWKGHISCSHVPTTRHNNPIRMFSQLHSTQVLPDNMLCKDSSHFH